MSGDQDDPLLKRAQKLQARTQQGGETETQSPSTAQSDRSLGKIGLLLKQIKETIASFWNHGLNPLVYFLNPLFKGYYKICRFLMRRFAYQDGQYQSKRGAMVAVFIVVMTYLSFWHLIPFTTKLSYDIAAVELFAYEDVQLFSKPDWVDGKENILSVFACRKSPCEGQTDSTEYRMRDSLWLDIKRTLTRFEPHDPGELAGAFISEENACYFKAYGTRVKFLGWYPYIIEATCNTVNGDDSDVVMQEMRDAYLEKLDVTE